MINWKIFSLGAFQLAFLFSISESGAIAQTNVPEKVFALVRRVEGKGIPKIRRMQGTETVVGEKTEIYAGDKVITDENSVVEILLHDGSIIRVGIRSEFRLDSAQIKPGFLSWVFGLAKGSVRALIEKAPAQKDVKFRINTPAGTIGVRGTGLLLEHRPDSGLTSLYTMEGNVSFGAPDCEAQKTCVQVPAGAVSSIHKGDKIPKTPAKYNPHELFGMAGKTAPGAAPGSPPSADLNRIFLFQGFKAVPELTVKMNDAELDDLVKKSAIQLQEAQDRFLGRDAGGREAMHQAMQDGTFSKYVKVAEAFVHLKGGELLVKPSLPSPPLFGPALAREFIFGKSIVESKTFRAAESAPVIEKQTGNAASEAVAKLEKASKWAEEIKSRPAPVVEEKKPVNLTQQYPTSEYGAAAIATREVMSDPAIAQNYEIYSAYRTQYSANHSGCGAELCSQLRTAFGAEIIPVLKAAAAKSIRGATPVASTTNASAAGGAAKAACANPVKECTYVPCQAIDPITKKAVTCKEPREQKCEMKCPAK